MLFSTTASVEAIEDKDKTNENVTWATPKAATHTNYRILWVLLGLVAVLTGGLCYLFTHILRIFELHRRNGERMKDELRTRFYEQDKKL